VTPPTRLVPRYLGQRLDGTLDDLHRALAFLAVDTCKGGRCGPQEHCAKHQARQQRRRQEQAGGGS